MVKHINKKFSIAILFVTVMIMAGFAGLNYTSSNNISNNVKVNNIYTINNKYIDPYWSVFIIKNNNLYYEKLSFLNYNKTNNNTFMIYGNSNIMMYCEYIYNNNTLTSKLFMNVKKSGDYIILFNVLTHNSKDNNYTSIINNKNINLNGIDISGSDYGIIHHNNNIAIASMPYYINSVPSNGFIYIDPIIKPDYMTYGKYTWSLSGVTQTSSTDILKNGNIKLKIDVTSYSASSSCPATLEFMVSNSTESECADIVSAGGTGCYCYNWQSNLDGNIHFYARYVSYCYYRPQSTCWSYSNFGGSNFKVTNYYHYIGYDGNHVIYLSTYGSYNEKIYGNEYINSTDVFNKNAGHYCFANNSIIVANTEYTTYEIDDTCGEKFNINFNLSAVGAATQYCSYPASGKQVDRGPAKQIIEIKTDNAPGHEHTCIKTPYARGFNVTDTYQKSNNIDKGINALILSGLDLIPVYGYFVTALSDACIISNMIKGITPNSYANATDNNLASATFYIDGGSRIDKDKYYEACDIGQNVFSTGINADISIPASELTHNFTITITYYDKYATIWSSNIGEINSASITQTINAVTSSAIYGTVGLTPGCGDGYDPNLTSSLYIENVNTHTMYNVTIKNGSFIFFAQPDTEYKLYYLDKNNNALEEFKLNNGTIINYIETGSAGSYTYKLLYE